MNSWILTGLFLYILKINECGNSFDHIDTLKYISTIEYLEEKNVLI